jgi:hypothetical protein
MNDRYIFDVDLARCLVADGREAVLLDRPSVSDAVRYSTIRHEHIAHVDPSIPGIISHVWFVEEDGRTVHGHLLIDGNHRAAHCLETNRDFFAHLLSEEESRQILLRSPTTGDAGESAFAEKEPTTA